MKLKFLRSWPGRQSPMSAQTGNVSHISTQIIKHIGRSGIDSYLRMASCIGGGSVRPPVGTALNWSCQRPGEPR